MQRVRSIRRGGLALALCLAVSGLAVVPAAGDQAPAYQVVTLAHVGSGTTASAAGLNDTGTVVGTGRTTTASRPQVAVRWDASAPGAANGMGLLDGSTFARAFDVNASGTAVGEAFDASGSSVAVRWDPTGSVAFVGSLNARNTGVANDVNDAGVIVGSSSNGSVVRAFRSTSTGIEELPLPTNAAEVRATVANAISSRGTVVGWASVMHPADEDHGYAHTLQTPVVWWADGTRGLLTPPGGEEVTSVATGVSDTDVVVGYATRSSVDTGVEWKGGRSTELAPSVDGATGVPWKHSRALAAHGDLAVGYSSKLAGNYSFGGSATLWRGTDAVDLNTQVDLPDSTTLLAATDINARNEISAVASVDGVTTPVLLRPVAAEKLPTTLLASSTALAYGRSGALDIEASGAAGGTVDLFEGVRLLASVELASGRARLILPSRSLRPGHHLLTVSYHGSSTHMVAETTASVTVVRSSPSLQAAVRRPVARPGSRAVVRVRVGADGIVPDGRVEIRRGGRRIAVGTLRDGVVRLRATLPERAGRHRLHVRYLGTEEVRPASATVKVAVRRR